MTDKYNHYTEKKDLLENQVVLVTGASKGIGRAVAIAASSCGAKVILHGRDIKALEGVHDEIVALGGSNPSIVPLDLTALTWEDSIAFANAIAEEIGQLDGMVHNAGVLGPRTPIEQYPLEAWQEVIQVNLTAPFLLTRACLPLIKHSHNASIIFTL
ncbi:MAG: SDR family NAD(P)-dependent oxidoreductase [Gammaproteobacteria bacterium]